MGMRGEGEDEKLGWGVVGLQWPQKRGWREGWGTDQEMQAVNKLKEVTHNVRQTDPNRDTQRLTYDQRHWFTGLDRLVKPVLFLCYMQSSYLLDDTFTCLLLSGFKAL